jgi:predicted amidophosphoribosyltransferase
MSFQLIKNKLTHIAHLLQPSCCNFCQQRQSEPVCSSCLRELKENLNYRQCLICGRPHLSWVCQSCHTAGWAFDQTVALANETSRLVPCVKAFHLHGHIAQLAVIQYAWAIIKHPKMAPVDLIIPFPENLKVSQSRGFWSALELAKTWSKLSKSPYCRGLITASPHPLAQKKDVATHSFQMNVEIISTLPITNFRIAIILPYMHRPHQLHEIAKILKNYGARSVINWVLIRDSSKENM